VLMIIIGCFACVYTLCQRVPYAESNQTVRVPKQHHQTIWESNAAFESLGWHWHRLVLVWTLMLDVILNKDLLGRYTIMCAFERFCSWPTTALAVRGGTQVPLAGGRKGLWNPARTQTGAVCLGFRVWTSVQAPIGSLVIVGLGLRGWCSVYSTSGAVPVICNMSQHVIFHTSVQQTQGS
jgi:hypothetical protein